MKSLWRLRRYVRPYLGALALGLLHSLIVALATAAVTALVKPMFNDVFFLGSGPSPAAVVLPAADAPPGGGIPAAPSLPGADRLESWRHGLEADVATLARERFGYSRERAWVYIPGLLIAAFLIKGLFTYFSNFRLGMIGLRVVQDLRADLFDRIQSQSLRFFSNHPTGLLTSRVTSDVVILQSILGAPSADMVRLAFSFVFLLAAAILLDWRLSLICMFVLPATVWPVARFSRKIKRSTSASQSGLADLADRLQETITGRRIVRGFNTETWERGRFAVVLERMLRSDRRALKYVSLTQPAIELVGALAMAGVAAFAGWRIHRGRLNPGDFVATLAALYWMYAILKKFARFGNDLTRGSAAAERIFEILDLERDVVEAPDATPLAPFARDIRLRNASFAYGDRPVLSGIDLTVRRGETVALVGSSGAGKTSLVNLVPRFYDVTGGAVEIDGHDVRGVTLRSLRSQIGLVTQEIVVFNESARHNIAYGQPDLPLDRVVEAARAAHAHEFIAALPAGYDTLLGEGGQSLSVGQRQRIAIARALLRDAPILILDEATSALDTESEALVQAALSRLMRDRTVIVIAHRLSTVRSADRIVVLDGGRVVEEGTHEALLAANGAYARLHRMQFAADLTARP